MKRFGVATAVIVGLLTVIATVPASASATCVQVKTGEPSSYEPECVSGKAGGGWAKVTTILGGLTGARCARLELVAELPGAWSNGACTETVGTKEWVKLPGHFFAVKGTQITGPHTLKETLLSGSYVLLGKPFLVAVHIECTKTEPSGMLENKDTIGVVMTFSNCTVTKPANCTLPEYAFSMKVLLIGASPGVEVELKPKTNTTSFTTITLEGASCSLKEPFEITGTQTCTLPGGETEAVSHEIACATSGSNLKAGGAAATFEGTFKGLELQTAEEWSAH